MKSQKRYAELDALRGIASLLVFFFHATMNRQGYNGIFKVGVTGVDLFFVISGFVIFMSLQRVSGGKEFMVNRVSRLYPTYWACVIFASLLMVAHSLYRSNFDIEPIKVIANLTMFQYYLGVNDIDGSYWTMIIEMIFYITVLILYVCGALNRIVLILFSISLSFVVLCYTIIDEKVISFIITMFPLIQFIPLFLSGIVFYKIMHNELARVYGYFIVGLCLLIQLALFPYVGRSRVFINWLEYSVIITGYFSLFWLFINGNLKLIVNRLSLFFGKISFALYLSHSYVSIHLIIPLFHDKLGLGFWIFVLFINLPAVVLVSYIITYYIEVPCSKYIKEKLTKRYVVIV